MKKRIIATIVIIAIIIVLVIPLVARDNSKKLAVEESPFSVCMISDTGDITDQAFNQTSYEACSAFCEKYGIPCTYKRPDSNTDYSITAMIDIAIAEGYNILVLPGNIFAAAITKVTFKYPDVKFISLDTGAGDIIAAAVGDDYYKNPDAYVLGDYCNLDNTTFSTYKEEISGYLAGYAAVKLGYTQLGYLGGQAVPPVKRYGYGYLQGIQKAGEEMGILDKITVDYAYAGQFFGSPEITAVIDTWYQNGTEVVFNCGGSVFTSSCEAAEKVGGHIIGVDNDQAPVIDVYGEGMCVTSALKNLTASINNILSSIILEGTWEEHVGKVECQGIVSPDDMSLNYVGLPMESTRWNDNFTKEDYVEMVKCIYNNEIQISVDIDKDPEVGYKLNMREGSIR